MAQLLVPTGCEGIWLLLCIAPALSPRHCWPCRFWFFSWAVVRVVLWQLPPWWLLGSQPDQIPSGRSSFGKISIVRCTLNQFLHHWPCSLPPSSTPDKKGFQHIPLLFDVLLTLTTEKLTKLLQCHVPQAPVSVGRETMVPQVFIFFVELHQLFAFAVRPLFLLFHFDSAENVRLHVWHRVIDFPLGGLPFLFALHFPDQTWPYATVCINFLTPSIVKLKLFAKVFKAVVFTALLLYSGLLESHKHGYCSRHCRIRYLSSSFSAGLSDVAESSWRASMTSTSSAAIFVNLQFSQSRRELWRVLRDKLQRHR